MHDLGQKEGARYGYLEMQGQALSAQRLGRLVGLPEPKLTELLEDLEGAGVFSRDESGIIYSRRFARDNLLKQIRSKAGSKGGSKTQANCKQTAKQPPSKGARSRTRTEEEEEVEEEESLKGVQGVVDLYHILCPDSPKVRTITRKRSQAIQARLKEGIEFEELFSRVAASEFLTGKIPTDKNPEGFLADIDFLTDLDNITKTLEGKYDQNKTADIADRNYSQAFS